MFKSRTQCVFKSLFVSALLLLLQSCAESKSPSLVDEHNADILISNVTVIDARNGTRVNVDVFISGGEISSVKQHEKGESAAAAHKKVDGSGKYLIPGLWDAHVHYTFDPAVTNSMNRLFIANGITSVRDTGGLLNLMLEVRENAKKEVSPDLYFAGPLLDGLPTVYKGDAPGFPEIGKGIANPEQATEAVDQMVAAGAHLIKAYEMLSPDTFKAILKRAKHHNRPVTGHVPLSMTAVEASNAGMNSMEHLRNLELACASDEGELLEQRKALLMNPENKLGSQVRTHIHSAQRSPAVANYDSEKCASLITTLIENNTWQVPTMALNLWAHTPYYADAKWQETYASLPSAVAQNWIEGSEQVAASISEKSTDNENAARHAQWQIGMLQRLIKAGVTIMAGTDTPIYFLTPGFSLHLELETLVKQGGYTNMQALESATLTPARYFGIDDTVGSIEAGMKADLVLLSANPLQDIQNTKAISAVIKAGEVFDRSALDKLLNAAD